MWSGVSKILLFPSLKSDLTKLSTFTIEYLMEQTTIETSRLLLRPVAKSDQQLVYEGFSHPNVTRYFDITYATFDDTHAQMEWYFNNREQGSGYAWVVCNKNTGETMGVFSIYYIEPKHRRAELGYWLLPPYWNKGYAFEGIKAILNYASLQLHLHRVSAEVEPDNQASIILLQKLGFERDGILRDFEWKNGAFQSLEVWSILM